MMNDEKIILAISAFCIIMTISGTLLIDFSTSQGGTEDVDPLGHWYASDCYGYDWNVDYVEYDPLESTEYDIDVFGSQDSLIYGNTNEMSFSGLGTNDGFQLTAINNEKTCVIIGTFDNHNLYAIILEIKHDSSGDVESTKTLNCIYTKEFGAETNHQDFPELATEWYCTSYELYTETGELSDLPLTDLKINEQNGSIMKISIADPEDGTLKECTAAFLKTTGSAFGLGVDTDDRHWYFEYTSDNFLYARCSTFFNTGDCIAVEGSYTVDPNRIPPKGEESGFENKQWKTTSAMEMGSDGTITHVSLSKYYLITDETGFFSSGVVSMGTEVRAFVSSNISFNNKLGCITASNTSDGVKYSTGLIIGETLCTVTHYIEGDVVKTAFYINEPYVISETSGDITGHWYATLVTGYDHRDYYQLDLSDSPEISQYDLDIYSVQNNLVYGWSFDNYMTGSYVNSVIIILHTVNNEKYRILGWVFDTNTMILNDVYIADQNSDEMIIAELIVYTKDRGAVVTPTKTIDLVDNWVSISATEYNPPNSITIPQSQLKIEEYKNNVFYGTMQKYIDSKLVTVSVNGTLVSFNDPNSAQGIMFDEDGLSWSISVTSDCVRLSTITGNDDIAGNEKSYEYIYSRDGTGTSPFTSTTNMVGTWKESESYSISERGIFSTLDNLDYTITFTNTYDGLCSGSIKYITLISDIASTQYIYGGSEMIKICYDYGNKLEYGYGAIIDENTFYVIDKYQDGAGTVHTQISFMKRVS